MDEFEMYIPEQDPVASRVRDLVSLGLAAKEAAGKNAEATDLLTAGMKLIVADLERQLTPEVRA
jgi:hypothetical protein